LATVKIPMSLGPPPKQLLIDQRPAAPDLAFGRDFRCYNFDTPYRLRKLAIV